MMMYIHYERCKVMSNNDIHRVSSPEDLEKYIKTANPFIWISIILTVAILFGFIIWGVIGNIDTSVSVGAISKGEKVICYVSEYQIEKISEGMSVEIGDKTGKVSDISESSVRVSDSTDLYALHLSGLNENDWVYTVEIGDIEMPKGTYEAIIITKSEKPISFIIN